MQMIGLGFLGKAWEPMQTPLLGAAMPSVQMKIFMGSQWAEWRGLEKKWGFGEITAGDETAIRYPNVCLDSIHL